MERCPSSLYVGSMVVKLAMKTIKNEVVAKMLDKTRLTNRVNKTLNIMIFVVPLRLRISSFEHYHHQELRTELCKGHER